MDIIKPGTGQQNDPWQLLSRFTPARIALGRTGNAMPLAAVLQLKAAHAEARDAVYAVLDNAHLEAGLSRIFDEVISLESLAGNRSEYLQRPDKGRQLNNPSVEILQGFVCERDILVVVADGLSATAVNKHAIPVLEILLPLLRADNIRLRFACVCTQARVAIADHIGSLVRAALTIILIGERPGLTSPDSMSAYITYAPSQGTTDEQRNCVSNIRPAGLAYQQAANTIYQLVSACLARRTSGIAIKDVQNHLLK